MRKHIGPLGLAAALLSPVPLGAQTLLTLEQALEQASARNPLIAAATREVQASDGALRQAGAWRNPEFSATLEDTRRDTRTTTATIGIPLEWGGQRAARVSVADRARDLAAATLDDTRAEVRARVVAAFFGVLVAQERAKLAADSAELAERAAEAVGKRVTAGKASPVEQTRIRVDEATVQLEAAEADAEFQTARHTLATQLGDDEPRFDTVAGDVAEVPSRPPVDELVARRDAAPALVANRLEVERRKAMVEVEQSKAVPELTLNLGATRDNQLGRHQAVVGFSIPLPWPGRNQGAVLEASRRAEKAADEFQAARLKWLADLREASTRLSVARASLQLLRSKVLPSAQQAQEAASKGFEAGKFGFMEVLDAQRTLLQARSRYLNTLAAAHQAAASIDRLVGR